MARTAAYIQSYSVIFPLPAPYACQAVLFQIYSFAGAVNLGIVFRGASILCHLPFARLLCLPGRPLPDLLVCGCGAGGDRVQQVLHPEAAPPLQVHPRRVPGA